MRQSSLAKLGLAALIVGVVACEEEPTDIPADEVDKYNGQGTDITLPSGQKVEGVKLNERQFWSFDETAYELSFTTGTVTHIDWPQRDWPDVDTLYVAAVEGGEESLSKGIVMKVSSGDPAQNERVLYIKDAAMPASILFEDFQVGDHTQYPTIIRQKQSNKGGWIYTLARRREIYVPGQVIKPGDFKG